jgi:hypothetical protein
LDINVGKINLPPQDSHESFDYRLRELAGWSESTADELWSALGKIQEEFDRSLAELDLRSQNSWDRIDRLEVFAGHAQPAFSEISGLLNKQSALENSCHMLRSDFA